MLAKLFHLSLPAKVEGNECQHEAGVAGTGASGDAWVVRKEPKVWQCNPVPRGQ